MDLRVLCVGVVCLFFFVISVPFPGYNIWRRGWDGS